MTQLRERMRLSSSLDLLASTAARDFETQRSLSRLIVNHPQIIDLVKGANRAAFAFGLSP
jgi:hypothetical protein